MARPKKPAKRTSTSKKASSKKSSSKKSSSKKVPPKKVPSKKASPKQPSSPMPPWTADVAARLAIARDLITARGGDATPYTPRDPMSATSIAAFEATHGIELPSDYRDLVEHLGIGIGPDSGILPLAAFTPSRMPSVTTTISSADGSITASAGTGPRPSLGRAANMAKPMPLDRRWEVGTPLSLAADEHVYDGCIELADLGCGYMLLLAISGPLANLVWEDTTAAYANGALHPIGPFRTWFDAWLDESLAWLASGVARSEVASSSKGVLKAALRVIEPVCLDEPHLLACLAYVKLALGDRAAALALLEQVPAADAPALRSQIYAKEIAAVSRDTPAVVHATHVAREVRVALAANPATPAATIEALTRDPDAEVRSRAARHGNAAPDVIERVAREGLAAIARGELGVEPAMVIELVVRSANATRELVEEVAATALAGLSEGTAAVASASAGASASSSAGSSARASAGSSANENVIDQRARAVVLRGVALSPMCPPDVRTRLARSPWPEVRHAVAASREASEADVRMLARDPNVAVRTAIAARRDAPVDVLRELARDTDVHLRHVLAANPRTPPEGLVDLARTGDALYGLGKNPALPQAIVDALALLAGYDKQKHEPDPADVPHARAWADEVDVDDNAATIPAADAVEIGRMRHWSYPVVALAARLGEDMGAYDIAGRPWLSDELVESCATDVYTYARAEIAERADVDERVLARLATDRSELVRQQVSANPRLSLHELLAMIDDDNEMVRMGAATNPRLPVEHRARLVGDKHPYTRRGVAMSPNATVGELARLAKDKSEDVRKWVPRAHAVTPELLAQLATDRDAQTAGRAKFRIAIEAYASELARS